MTRSIPTLLLVTALVLAACSPRATEEPTATTGATTTQAITATSEAGTTSTEPTTTTSEDDRVRIEVVYQDGEVTEGGGRHQVPQGSEVEIRVEADVVDEVHLHGYDLIAEVSPDQRAEIRFTADIPGIFEVELESSHRLLFELQVSP